VDAFKVSNDAEFETKLGRSATSSAPPPPSRFPLQSFYRASTAEIPAIPAGSPAVSTNLADRQ
jgi:hypothetical protein